MVDADSIGSGVEQGAVVIDIPHCHLHHGRGAQGICRMGEGETHLGKG